MKKPTFEDVGNNSEVSSEKEENTSIESILKKIANQPTPVQKRQVSIYLDKEVAREFDKFGKRGGKGSKSELVNEFLKEALKVEKNQ